MSGLECGRKMNIGTSWMCTRLFLSEGVWGLWCRREDECFFFEKCNLF